MSADPSPGADVARLDLAMEVEVLRAVHDRLRRAEEFFRIGHWEFSLDDQIMHASEGAMRIYGVDRADTPLADIKSQALPEYRPVLDRALRDLIERGVPYEQEFEIRRISDGEVVHVHTRAEHDARTGRVFGVLQDITERKRASEALRRSEARLLRVLEGSSDGFGDFEAATGRVTVTARYAQIYGMPAHTREVPVETLMALVEPADLPPIQADMAAIAAGEKDAHVWEYRIRRTDGTTRWIQSRGTVLGRDAAGRPSHVSGAITDITERKTAEAQLRASEERYRTLVQSMPLGVVYQDAHGGIISANPAAERILGLSLDQMQGRTSVDPQWRAIHEDGSDFPGTEHPAMLALRTGRQVLSQVMGIRTPAVEHHRWLSVSAVPQLDSSGQVVGVFVAFEDITSRKVADLEREALQAKLALASRLAAMGTLVAGVGHEINNPLAADLAGQGVALEESRAARDLLQKGAPPDLETQRRHLDVIIEALEDASEGSQRVARIVKDLAAFASPDPRRTRLRLPDVVASSIRWMPAAHGHRVAIRVEDHDPPPVLASAGQIEQVVVNLLTNAEKATPPGRPGEIVVRIGPGVPGMARLEVIDRGAGIAPGLRERIFEPFFTTRQAGAGRGAGLGLAICHTIITDHGGSLTVESELGKGSTFRVELPAAPAGS